MFIKTKFLHVISSENEFSIKEKNRIALKGFKSVTRSVLLFEKVLPHPKIKGMERYKQPDQCQNAAKSVFRQ
jgi:hypothetical protein